MGTREFVGITVTFVTDNLLERGDIEVNANLTVKALQEYIKGKDHHPELKLQYLQKLVEEVGELARAMRKDVRYAQTQDIKGTLEEELYDVLYYIVALSNVYDVDLENVMKLKEPISSAKYGQNGDRGSVEIESLMR
jgi:NTP pyrophosphatase (non-canonical NTP hydrolase)